MKAKSLRGVFGRQTNFNLGSEGRYIINSNAFGVIKTDMHKLL